MDQQKIRSFSYDKNHEPAELDWETVELILRVKRSNARSR